MTISDTLRHRFRLHLPPLLAAAALVGLAACGNGSQPPSHGAKAAAHPETRIAQPSSGSSHAAKITVPSNLCSLVGASDISQIVGQSMPAPQLSASGGGETDCDSNSPGSNVGLVAFSLFVENMYCFNGETPSAACLQATKRTFAFDKQYAQQRYGTLQDIAGLGDEAYCSIDTTAGVTTATVHVLAGWFRLDTSSDSCAHSQALAALLLPRI